ncbi:8-oxo-dGTP pyrophosphatase MutT, NUDIX family [Arboricoccus pini]|uniref:8-oxo-dGTP pyrophosphatase MutT, NUDIX family n=1 Tax=Arboricoccus pini TaxID=1963835 RepID=A0A212PX87_9PROT|nr:NUDIX domain-containing protein [Arboricoccus pini]SNB51533.1 8-oxo-dGTP pyrophosphatase MutT, NUDIX family [Arboricoccus pini]
MTFLSRLDAVVSHYLASVAEPREYLSLLRWQIAERHALDDRRTLPGHLTTSAIIVSPDRSQVLMIDHRTIGRWLQPGGHYEPAAHFFESAAREAVEETGVAGLRLHPWHDGQDLPFNIDSHDVPGKAARGEGPHVHHDLHYLFLADPGAPLVAQEEEVKAARWFPCEALADVAPRALARLRKLG